MNTFLAELANKENIWVKIETQVIFIKYDIYNKNIYQLSLSRAW